LDVERLLQLKSSSNGWFAGLKTFSETPDSEKDGKHAANVGIEDVVTTEDDMLDFVDENEVDEEMIDVVPEEVWANELIEEDDVAVEVLIDVVLETDLLVELVKEDDLVEEELIDFVLEEERADQLVDEEHLLVESLMEVELKDERVDELFSEDDFVDVDVELWIDKLVDSFVDVELEGVWIDELVDDLIDVELTIVWTDKCVTEDNLQVEVAEVVLRQEHAELIREVISPVHGDERAAGVEGTGQTVKLLQNWLASELLLMNARKHRSWVHPVLPAATDEITVKKIVIKRLIVDERVIFGVNVGDTRISILDER
jgi:hypothetical protein